jgi:type IV pilus assembly protein PilQ
VRAYQKSLGILTGVAIVLVAAPAARAADVQITGAKLETTESGVILLLETAGSSEVPQIFIVPKSGNRVEAAIANSQLYLPEGETRLRQENPIPGIAAIEMWQGSPDSVFISVMGSDRQPNGQILQQEAGAIVLGFEAGNTERFALQRQNDPRQSDPTFNTPPAPPVAREAFSPEQFAANSPQTAVTSPNPSSNTSPNPSIAPPAVNPQPNLPSYDPNTLRELLAQRSDAIAPNAQIIPEGNPAPLAQPAQPIVPVPPLLPQPVPPPVSPQAVANVNVSEEILDLGTAARVPRIVLQEAPAREVLSLLARSADLNLIFADDAEGNEEGGGRRISLDLQDEPVQDVFNYVIQATGLEATRKGRTIFVGTQLPVSAKDIISRTFRVNQISAVEASAFLTTLGAELQQQTVTTTINRTAVEAGLDTQIEGGDTEIGTLQTTSQTQLTTLSAGDDANGPLPLRGLTVSPDSRLQQVTIVGEPRLVQMAGSYLSQLDARVRQVAVNVKVIDVDLNNDARYGASFSWGIGDTGIINQNGIGIIGFGTDDSNVQEPVDGLESSFLNRGERTPQSAGAVTFDAIGTVLERLQIRQLQEISNL